MILWKIKVFFWSYSIQRNYFLGDQKFLQPQNILANLKMLYFYLKSSIFNGMLECLNIVNTVVCSGHQITNIFFKTHSSRKDILIRNHLFFDFYGLSSHSRGNEKYLRDQITTLKQFRTCSGHFKTTFWKKCFYAETALVDHKVSGNFYTHSKAATLTTLRVETSLFTIPNCLESFSTYLTLSSQSGITWLVKVNLKSVDTT